MSNEETSVAIPPPFKLELKKPQPEKNGTLNVHARSVYSREGIDGIIEYIFSVIGAKNKQAVDFGAMDGKRGCNTLNLVRHHGWHSLMIEGNVNFFQALQKTAEEEKGNITAVHGCVGIERYPLLDTYVDKCPKDLDLMSIDIDGVDYFVWESLTAVRPRVIIIEFTYCVPADVVFVQARDESISEGASAAALVELGKSKKYSLAAVTKSNLIFVVDEEFDKLGLKDNSLERLWLTPFCGRIFACQNGKLYTAGMEKLPSAFKKLPEPIRYDTLQVIDFAKNDYSEYLAAPLDEAMAQSYIKSRSRAYRLYTKAVRMAKKVVGRS